MRRFKFHPQYFCLLFACLSIVVGCGKKQSETSSSGSGGQITKPNPLPIGGELEEFLNKQSVHCGPDECPDYISKIVVIDRGEAKFCTGFLTDTGTVATSASCLPELLRFQGQSCENEIFFYFPETPSKPAVRAGCRKVLQASRIDTTSSVTTWRENIAFLELDQNIYRRSLKISRDGLENKKKYNMWKVDQLTDNFAGLIRKEECVALHGTYMNPLASNKYSPNMLLGDCTFANGNAGAPIVVGNSIRGIATSDIDHSVSNFLVANGLIKKEELSPMIFANNMSCTTNIDDNRGYLYPECVKDLSSVSLSFLRGRLVDENDMFASYLKETQESISSNNQYVKFGTHLVESVKGKYNVLFYPKCFINVEQWRNKPPRSKTFTVSGPYYEVSRASDNYTRIKVNMISSKSTQFKIEFDPRKVLDNSASISIRSNPYNNQFYNIPSACPQ